jgi:Flp pilus assembly pilin Flp
MSTIKSIAAKLIIDETGGEALEYILVTGFIVIVSLVACGAVGTKALARWTSLGMSL